ncbi:MAG: hypothetical protein HUU27_02935, partial [Phycisphaerae bacterium]|nr:hypothetical protein [Phycisphaerae bacterium]
ERVEGYTNLLWLLACAGLGALGVDLVDAARALGIVSTAGALVAVALTLRPRRFDEVAAPLAATVGLALTGTFAVWAIGGLEQPFVACFLAWSIALLLPALQEERGVVRILLAGLMLGLLCLSRADGPVLCVAVGVGLLAALHLSSRAWRSVLLLAVVPLVLTGGQLLFRYLYYGDLVPNSARVKVAFSTHRVASGSAYVWHGVLAYAPMVLAAIAAALVCARQTQARRRITFLVAIPLVWLAYVAFVGGDIFPARRQWAAPLIPIAIMAGELLRFVNDRPAWGRAAAAALAAGVVAITGFQQTASSDPEVLKARWERWEWDGLAVGELLRAAFEEQQPLLAVDPAGALPYYSRLPALDMLGLNDRHIASNPPVDFGRGWMGHELGDGKYVLDCKPDLVVFEVPAGRERAFFLSGRQMQGDDELRIPADPRFAELYRLIQFEAARGDASPIKGPAVRSVIWTRIEDGRIGVERGADRLVVPGYLLAAPPDAVARLDKRGRLVCVITTSGGGHLSRLSLGAGRWRVSADADGPLRLEIRTTGAQRSLFSGSPPGSFALAADEPPEIDVSARTPDRSEIRRVVIEVQD